MECKSAWRLNALESAFRFSTVQGSLLPCGSMPQKSSQQPLLENPQKKRWHLFAILIFLSRFGEMPWCFWSKLVGV